MVFVAFSSSLEASSCLSPARSLSLSLDRNSAGAERALTSGAIGWRSEKERCMVSAVVNEVLFEERVVNLSKKKKKKRRRK